MFAGILVSSLEGIYCVLEIEKKKRCWGALCLTKSSFFVLQKGNSPSAHNSSPTHLNATPNSYSRQLRHQNKHPNTNELTVFFHCLKLL